MSDWQNPFIARSYQTWRGMPVVISHDVPRLHVGTEIVPRYRWLWPYRRFIPHRWRPAPFQHGAKIEQDQVMQAAGKLFMSPAMWGELNR